MTLPLYCLWSSSKPVGASLSGQGEEAVLTFVAAGDCEVWLPAGASSMVCWGKLFSASVAAVMLNVGSIGMFFVWAHVGCKGA